MAMQAILAPCCQDPFAVNFKIASSIQFTDFKNRKHSGFRSRVGNKGSAVRWAAER